MVAFDTVVSVLFVDMGDVVKVWIISVIYISYGLVVGRRFVSADRHWSMEPNAFDSLV